MQLSPIQNHIISRLKNADSLRYSDMKPRDTANDLYNYHLKELLRKRLIAKIENGYTLTETGRQRVADVHHTSDQANRLFKINVITIVVRRTDQGVEVLNQVRHSQPSFGKVGVMGGTVVKGEPLLDAAARKLFTETGVTATFRLLGYERRISYEGDVLFSDILFPICYSDTSSGEPVDTEFGHNFWSPIAEAIQHETDPHDSIASIRTCLQAIQDGTIAHLPLFYTETEQQRIS
jgi:8-oxo-dGTP pyrophosphatase MutT (NUDIX family)